MSAMTARTDPVGLPPRPLTVADLEGMPNDGHRYELLDGVLIVTPAPAWFHQRAVGRLYRLLDDAAPAGLETLVAPFAVRPGGGDPSERSTELQPDVLVARVADLAHAQLTSAPVLAVEVLSPSTRLVDLNLKRAAYERMGVPSFWVVDPSTPDLRVLELDSQGSYVVVARVTGRDTWAAELPFPVVVCPATLVEDR